MQLKTPRRMKRSRWVHLKLLYTGLPDGVVFSCLFHLLEVSCLLSVATNHSVHAAYAPCDTFLPEEKHKTETAQISNALCDSLDALYPR